MECRDFRRYTDKSGEIRIGKPEGIRDCVTETDPHFVLKGNFTQEGAVAKMSGLNLNNEVNPEDITVKRAVTG